MKNLSTITLRRYKTTPHYTLSRLQFNDNGTLRDFSVVEPPVSTKSDYQPRAIATGRYKLFVKPDIKRATVVLCMQRYRGLPRMGFEPVQSETPLSQLNFGTMDSSVIRCPMFLGKFSPDTQQLSPLPEVYNRLMMCVIIAKQYHQSVYLDIQ